MCIQPENQNKLFLGVKQPNDMQEAHEEAKEEVNVTTELPDNDSYEDFFEPEFSDIERCRCCFGDYQHYPITEELVNSRPVFIWVCQHCYEALIAQ